MTTSSRKSHLEVGICRSPDLSALTLRGDPYEFHDPVFGVKESLMIDLGEVSDEMADKYGMAVGSKLLQYDFVLESNEEAAELRKEQAKAVMGKVSFYKDMPFPAVD